jgi:hypothetical protein
MRLPKNPMYKMIDDKMQAGYVALEERDSVGACRPWLEAWQAILEMMAQSGMHSLDEFDDEFGGTQSVLNWVQDLETELHNAGLEEPDFFRERIAFCETMLARFSGGWLPMDNFQTALAQSHFELGDRETGDGLFRRWLDESPQWGGGWIAWSDSHWLFAAQRNKDAARAEQILKEGLATPEVENRADLLDRLAMLYEETGRGEEAAVLRQEIQQTPDSKRTATVRREPGFTQFKEIFDFGQDGPSLNELPNLAKSLNSAPATAEERSGRQSRVGRNEPCPCGSGKKYKKCCGRPDASSP